MKRGELEAAVRRALSLFHQWNDVTGVFLQGTGTMYEVEGLIEDAVHCGAQAATGDMGRLDGEPFSIFRAARSAGKQAPIVTVEGERAIHERRAREEEQ